jgi:hypothetical protein
MKPAPAIPKTLEAKVARVARQLRKAPRLVLKEAIDGSGPGFRRPVLIVQG